MHGCSLLHDTGVVFTVMVHLRIYPSHVVDVNGIYKSCTKYSASSLSDLYSGGKAFEISSK